MEPQKLPNVASYGPCNLRIGENIIDNDRKITLKHGETKSWCTCGLSKKQPFCDGSHKNTDFRSLKWKIPDNQKFFSLCNCKYTRSPPYCDGSHIDADEKCDPEKYPFKDKMVCFKNSCVEMVDKMRKTKEEGGKVTNCDVSDIEDLCQVPKGRGHNHHVCKFLKK